MGEKALRIPDDRSRSHDDRGGSRTNRSGNRNNYAVLIAVEAQGIVFDAAKPIFPGEGAKAQMRRAWAALGRPQFWRVRSAWYGEAGVWTAVALEDLRQRDRARRGGSSEA
jgi:hypothetical protein